MPSYILCNNVNRTHSYLFINAQNSTQFQNTIRKMIKQTKILSHKKILFQNEKEAKLNQEQIIILKTHKNI